MGAGAPVRGALSRVFGPQDEEEESDDEGPMHEVGEEDAEA